MKNPKKKGVWFHFKCHIMGTKTEFCRKDFHGPWSSVCEGRQVHGALRLPHGPRTPARDTKTQRERDRTREKHLWWAPKRSNCVTVGEFMSSEVIPIKHSVSSSSRRNKWTASVISGYVSVLTKDTIKHTHLTPVAFTRTGSWKHASHVKIRPNDYTKTCFYFRSWSSSFHFHIWREKIIALYFWQYCV